MTTKDNQYKKMARLIKFYDTPENLELFDWINKKYNSDDFIIKVLLKEFNNSKERRVGINGEMSRYRK